MRFVFVLLAVGILIAAGCTGTQTAKNESGTPAVVPAGNNGTAPQPAPTENASAPASPTPAPVPTTNPAATQADCATLSPNCGSCISKPGCGWCKTSNSCFLGNSNGPSVGQCQPADWAVTDSECKAPTTTVGTTCAQQYNCAQCLSGSGCKWCIQGSKCTDSDSSEDCFGGWLNQSYQCNFAGR